MNLAEAPSAMSRAETEAYTPKTTKKITPHTALPQTLQPIEMVSLTHCGRWSTLAHGP